MAGERTEAPTPRRQQDARRRGQVARSQELVSIGVLFVAVVGLRFLGAHTWNGLADILRDGLIDVPSEELTPELTMQMARDIGGRMLLLLAPLFAVLALAAVAINLAQSGFILSGQSIRPKFSHISPAAGLKRIVGKDGLVNLFKSLAKMAVIALVVFLTMRGQLASIVGLGHLSPGAAVARLGMLSFDIAIRAAGVLLAVAAADYLWQRRRFQSQLRMTKEEVRQELKETDGDPQIKAAIRRRRQQLMNRMLAAVPKADVVVTNPTHYAVAIRYDPVSMGAPVVVAKGERLIALRIKEVARKHGVPVLEEPPLARALFAAVQVGHPIPAQLFRAVAEVLAWVYGLRAKAAFRPVARPAGQGA
jgi:flagellar biosynthetic protein FlhB